MKKIIIKLGTGILSQGEGKIRTDRMDNLANDIAKLSQNGIKFIIVSSGAVGLGMGKLGLSERLKGFIAFKSMCFDRTMSVDERLEPITRKVSSSCFTSPSYTRRFRK